jgi:hypothetical protein
MTREDARRGDLFFIKGSHITLGFQALCLETFFESKKEKGIICEDDSYLRRFRINQVIHTSGQRIVDKGIM